MSLSPYVQQQNLNGALTSTLTPRATSMIGGKLFPDAFDKRTNGGGFGQYLVKATEIVDTVADVADTIANAVGARSPLYSIGQITSRPTIESAWNPSATTGLIRALSSTLQTATTFGLGNDITQEGVIIDGIGDVDAEMSVDFSKNPSVYMTDQIIDNRVRVPATVRMTVMVSNYLNDDLAETIVDGISALDPTGLVSSFDNYLMNDGYTRAQSKLYQLRNLMENGRPFDVYTPHGVYSNMLIRSLKPRTSAETMDMLYCDIEFQEVILYAPYSTEPGFLPARRGTDVVQAGCTKKMVEQAAAWTSDAGKFAWRGITTGYGLWG